MKRQCPIGKDLMITDTWVYFSSSSEQNNSLQLHIYISFSITLETHTHNVLPHTVLCVCQQLHRSILIFISFGLKIDLQPCLLVVK